MSHSVQVSGISPTTTEASLHEFFTFCGTITSVDFKEEEKAATIHFEKPSAAKTALMLNGGSLDGAALTVTSEVDHVDEPATEHKEGAPIEQSDKPRAGIVAEYLAKGYLLSDQILHRAIEIDSKQGISTRFLAYFQSLDSTLGARALGPDQKISAKVQETVAGVSQQAKTVDAEKGYSKTAHDYYTKALSSPFGLKVKAFYTDTSKQVLDIHEEAKRISAAKKAAAPTESPATETGTKTA